MQLKLILLSKNKLLLQAINENFIFDAFAILILSKSLQNKDVLSSTPHCDGNSYADMLKNPHMRKIQLKLKNQHAGNRPLTRTDVIF